MKEELGLSGKELPSMNMDEKVSFFLIIVNVSDFFRNVFMAYGKEKVEHLVLLTLQPVLQLCLSVEEQENGTARPLEKT